MIEEYIGFFGLVAIIAIRYVIEVHQFDDCHMTDYVGRVGGEWAAISLYVAYYDLQKKGALIHSAKSCSILGGGWKIRKNTVESIALGKGKAVDVNRLLIHEERIQAVPLLLVRSVWQHADE